jgi:hypothetical protein
MFLHFAAGKVDIDPTMDEGEIAEAMEELDEVPTGGRTGPYWPRIRTTLLAHIASSDIEEAIKEWKFTRMWSNHSSCELCGHTPIKFHFQIVNRMNGSKLVVGSECIYNYLVIPGAPDKKMLKKRLNQLRNRAKAVAEGQASEDDLAKLQVAQEMERDLNLLINRVCAPDKDTDVDELAKLLREPVDVGRSLNLHTQSFKEVETAWSAIRDLSRFLGTLSKRSTKYKTAEMLPAINAIMGFRSGVDDQIRLLTLFKDRVAKAFNAAGAGALVQMGWDEVKTGRSQGLNKLNDALEAAKSGCQRTYSDTLEYVRACDHLQFMVQAGVDSNKAQMDKQAEVTRKLIESPDFFDELGKGGRYAFQKLLPSFNTTLSTGDSRMEDAAVGVLQFIQAVRGTIPHALTQAMFAIWGTGVRDYVGLRKAILRAADDGLINPESGTNAINELTELLRKSDPKAMDLFQEESDDIKAAIKAGKKQKVYEAMSEAWDFDVKKFYSTVPWDHPYFPHFCTQMLRSFRNGRQDATAKERASISKNMAKYRTPVPNSCWDKLQRDLLAPHNPSYGYAR